MRERAGDGGGSDDRLAPVIPLFGDRARGRRAEAEGEPAVAAPVEAVPAEAVPAEAEPAGTESAVAEPAAGWSHTWADDRVRDERFAAVGDELSDDADGAPDAAVVRAAGEKSLLRKLRTRSLSVIEARRHLADHDVARDDADLVVDDFVWRGYLDDAALADQLVRIGTERKGQGRRAIGVTLTSRGIPRDVADAALAQLPDDDAERAWEVARAKARSLDRVDDDTAYRRLVGALARRGFGGSAASAAARGALDERRTERDGGSGVRFR